MLRQLWIYLLPDDLDALCAAIEGIEPGIAIARGRCFRGEPASLAEPAQAASLDYQPGSGLEERRIVFHRAHSAKIETYPSPEGAHCIDERRSECLVLTAPLVQDRALAPARLAAETHYFEAGGRRVRKSRAFADWATRVFRGLGERFPRTGISFIQVAPAAEAWARAGEGRLEYLHQPISIDPVPEATPVHEPQRK